MKKKYSHKKIETKWQRKWDKTEIYKADDFSKKPKYYCLIEFPYPSGAGLHVGHLRSHIAIDIVARKKRMSGFNVLYPIGWDAFGLPTENFAIKTKTHPAAVTKNNVRNFTKQIKSYGPSFDWSREINTTDPAYYKWTQWIFLKLFNSYYDEKLDRARPIEELDIPENLDEFEKKEFIDSKRLAYESEMAINWCPSCKIGLANEEVVDGSCERCGAKAEKRMRRQWMLGITKYAERLIRDLDNVDYLEKIKTQQINWIGKSEGAEVEFKIKGNEQKIKVFTTRIDTIFGCTYIVLAPEHSLIEKLESEINNFNDVLAYVKQSRNKSDLDRTDLAKEKTGIELKGLKAINPLSGEEIPIWIADYVLISYGTGAIMAVPAHDERDHEFAVKYRLPIKQVIAPHAVDEYNPPVKGKEDTIRRVVHIILENVAGDEILTLNLKGEEWGKNKPKTFIIGGIENGETPESAAIREIKEETGYTDVEIIRTHPIEFHAEFFAKHKNVNRYVKTVGVICRLRSKDQAHIAENEKKMHDIVWIKRNLISSFVTIPDDIYLANAYIKNIDTFIGHGILVNSGKHDGLNCVEARDKMSDWLEKNKIGKKTVNYKLRDWVFSRQHYWGEPIPIVKCKHCGISDTLFKMELNFRDNKVWNQIIDRKKTIETRALNPDEKKRFFGDIKTGDVVKFNNKNTGDFEVVRIKKVYNFRDLEDLYTNSELIPKILPDIKIQRIKDLEKAYCFTADYIDRITKNGLIGWEFEILNITKNISIPEKLLPLELPNVKNYEPTETGESPLANIKDWVNIKCPLCKSYVKRETDTMPNWAGSSWYFLRYLDPKNQKEFAAKKKIDHWMPVDLYNGGMEHTTLHLLYSRFWHKFLFDLGYVNTSEPYKTRRSHGMILAEDGQKMSKSRGNVVNPDEVIKKYGADTLRLYEMFMGPYSEAIPWSTTSLIGMNRFLDRVWNLQYKVEKKAKKSQEAKQQTILVATNNQGKIRELKDHFKNISIICLSDIKKKIKEPMENGKTYADNSLIKARYYAKKTGYLTVADDSGFSVHALKGKPGVFSSRYASGDYKKAQLQIIADLKEKNDRSAYFKSVITIYDPLNDTFKQFDGICSGTVSMEPKGNGGFGYDPIFIPEGVDKTFGEMENTDKYKYDHRKKAVDKLIVYLDQQKIGKCPDTLQTLHRTIKKVSEDIDSLKFNTAISQLMILSNEYEKASIVSKSEFECYITLLSPFVPHMTEQLWYNLGNKHSIHIEKWPAYDASLAKENEIELVIQINGKVRERISAPAGISEGSAKKIALESEKVKKWIEGKQIKKFLFIKGRLVNIVV